jgi:hypothetical protein
VNSHCSKRCNNFQRGSDLLPAIVAAMTINGIRTERT